MQKKKVVLIHNIISPHVTTLFCELAKKVDLTVLYCAVSEENRQWRDKPKGFNYKILPSKSVTFRGKDLFTYFINFSIFTELRSLKPDVVVISGWDLFAYQAAFVFCKLKKIKLVVWSGSTNLERSWRRTISLPLVKMIVKNADSLIAYGTRARDYLISMGAKKPDIFIYNHSTDVGIFKINKKHMNSNVILYYGQLIERKGVDLLIQAYSVLRKNRHNIKLLIVGSGQLKSELKLKAKKIGLKGVAFVDDPGDKYMEKYFSLASVLVLPSREEVWGLVVNIALGNGIPVVVSDAAGCCPDLVKEGVNGYIFRNGNSNDLYLKLDNYFRSPLTMKTLSKNAKLSVAKFTPAESSLIMAKAINYA